VLTNTRSDMSVVREEIFGPVLVASPFTDLEETAGVANDTEYGLGAGIWTKDQQIRTRAPSPTSAGGWALNSPAAHPGSDGRGYHGSLGNRRAAPGCHGGGYYRGLGNRRADDADSPDTCWPEWHRQPPAVAVASSASIEAMIA
jgi:acyl-CoA reductase-like NAD-dependent aldehyde dehydrogenase